MTLIFDVLKSYSFTPLSVSL